MFSNDTRCILKNNQLAEVICQLRFPDILMIGEQVPARFQEAIRSEFPQYSVRKEVPAPKLTGAPGNVTVENPPAITNYQFASADGKVRVNLTSNFISLSCSNYTDWEHFAKYLDKPLAAFIQIYKPAYFHRIGLRYINFIAKESLGLSHLPYRALIDAAYLGPIGQENIDEKSFSRCSIDAQFSIQGGCMAKIHAGPGQVRQKETNTGEIRFVFDLDLSMSGNVPVNHSAGALQTLHAQAYPLFRSAITDTLFNAMEPIAI